jgi:hypothetical protein
MAIVPPRVNTATWADDEREAIIEPLFLLCAKVGAEIA